MGLKAVRPHAATPFHSTWAQATLHVGGSEGQTDLREPPEEVVHDHSCDEGCAQPGGQADQGVPQQRLLHDGDLVGSLYDACRIHPRARGKAADIE